MHIEQWHKEAWIKNLHLHFSDPRGEFVRWCRANHPAYSEDEAGIIYDSHVMPQEERELFVREIEEEDE